MVLLDHLRIGRKIGAVLAVIVAIVLAGSLFSLTRLGALSQATVEVADLWLPKVRLLGEMKALVIEHRQIELARMVSETEAERAEMDGRLAKTRTELDARKAEYAKFPASEESRALYAAFSAEWDKYLVVAARVIELVRAGNLHDARALQVSEGRAMFRAARAALDQDIVLGNKGAEAARERAQRIDEQSRLAMILAGALVVALTIGATLLLTRAVARPISEMTAAMRRLAEGELDLAIPAQGRGDEIGAMAEAVAVFKDNALRARALAAEQEAARAAREARAQTITRLTGAFDASVTGVLDIVAGATTEMEATASAMSANAEQTSRQAASVAAASAQASSSVQTVASAAEELAASIAEIGRQVEQSARLSRAASDEANVTNEVMKSLADSSARIGTVVELIDDIAGQTNLLALNATIEAARAGEAGKGFAVVAGEVKSLANQTARATGEIGAQIGAVQSASQRAVSAIAAIVGRIDQINHIASAIASAVEQQSAATSEIARNVQQAAEGTNVIAGTIGGVTSAAADTGSAAAQVLSAAQSLAEQAAALKQTVDGFLDGVRSA
jgi:methyl-accepting chemotaxis protein